MVDGADGAHQRSGWWRALGSWVLVASGLQVAQHVASRVLVERPYEFRWRGFDWFASPWSQFDGPEYLRIVTSGYSYTPGVRSNIVWFPLYPLLVRGVDSWIGLPLASGILVSALAGAAASVALWCWLTQQQVGDGPRSHVRLVAFLAVMLYPYAWYLYGVVHSDALFLLLVLGAFLLVERDHLVAAGLVGALATATRPTGLALVGGLVLLGLERRGVLSVPDDARGVVARWRLPVRFDRRRLTPSTLAPLLSVLGVTAWATWLGVTFGDPLAFQSNQRVYHPSPLPWLKLPYFRRLLTWEEPSYVLTTTLQALLLVVVILSIPAVIRRFGAGYGVFVGALAMIPTVATADFMGTGRYLIAAFPVWAMWGERLARRPRGWLVVAGSGTLMFAMAMGFSRSWYLT